MRRFYIQNYISGQNFQELSEEEAYHAAKVLRLDSGGTVEGFDGNGKLIKGILQLEQLNSKKFRAKIVDFEILENNNPARKNITLIISSIKLDRLEWLLEKCTEIGVGKIIITHTKYSQIPLDLILKKLERLKTIVMNACKQSENLYLPEISISDMKDILKVKFSKDGLSLVATTEIPGESLRSIISKNSCENLCIWIGPEGGFEKTELDEIVKFGFVPCKLGENILRAETAAVVGVWEMVNGLE